MKQYLTVEITETSCIVPHVTYIAYANTDSTVTLTGLDSLDARCKMGDDVIMINNEPVANYPWLTQTGNSNQLTLVVSDPDNITLEGQFTGTH